MSDTRAFKVALKAAILALTTKPEGFTRADLASRLGVEYLAPGPARARLLRIVDRYAENGLLDRCGRGRFKAGERFADDDSLGVSVRLAAEIHDAFVNAGGVMSMKDLLRELDRDGDSTLVRRIMSASPDFDHGIPATGFKTAWKLVDSKRLDVPIPGHLLAYEFEMLTGGNRPPDMPRLIRERRQRIGTALREARWYADMTIEDLIAQPAVAGALEDAMRRCEARLHGEDGRSTTVAAWWDQTRAAKSRRTALVTAWGRFEAGDDLLIATTVRFWQVVGRVLKLSPGHLSRGCTAPLDWAPNQRAMKSNEMKDQRGDQ